MDGDEGFLETMGFDYAETQPQSPIGEQTTPSTIYCFLLVVRTIYCFLLVVVRTM